MVSDNSDDAAYLFDFDGLLGVMVNGEARAYPHNIERSASVARVTITIEQA